MEDLYTIIVTFQDDICVKTMDNFNQVLKLSYDWAMCRIHALAATADAHYVDDAISIHDEFREWFDDGVDEHDIVSLAYIGEGSEYAE